MPIYDFRCHACGEVSEFLVPSSEDSGILACPRCGNPNMERLMSAPRLLRNTTNSSTTCCGRTERCDKPPCSSGGKRTRD